MSDAEHKTTDLAMEHLREHFREHPPTLGEMRQFLWELTRVVKDANDPRDHGPAGRWPVIHSIAAVIDQAERRIAAEKGVQHER